MVTVIAGTGAFIVQSHATFERRQALSIDRKRALYVAEAGIAEATLAISQGRSGAIGTEETPVVFHEGIYWVESEPLEDGRRLITSRSRVGTGRFTLRETIRPNVNAIAEGGFFGEDEVVIGDAVLIDGFDGRLVDFNDAAVSGYGLPTTGDGALVRSNGSITIEDASAWPKDRLDPYKAHVATLPATVRARLSIEDPSSIVRLAISALGAVPLETKVLGELRPGVDKALVSNGKSELKVLVPSVRAFEMPEMLVPQTRRVISIETLRVNTYRNAGQVSAQAGRIEVAPGGELVLEGPSVLHLKSFDLASGALLRLDDRLGPIFVYIEESLQLHAGALIVSLGAEAAHFGTSIFVSPGDGLTLPQPLQFASSGVFRGLVYAPGHELTLPTGLRFIGAAAAKRLIVADGAWLTYDRALLTNGSGVPAIPQKDGWQILAEEPGFAPPLRFDPIADLARRGITPFASASAALEQSGRIDYFDTSGLKQTYEGVISGPVLAAMDRVVTLAWLDPVTSAYGPELRPTGLDPDALVAADRKNKRKKKKQQDDDDDD